MAVGTRPAEPAWALRVVGTVAIDVEVGEAGSEVLGIWTSHIALLFGRELKPADINTIYPRAEQEGQPR